MLHRSRANLWRRRYATGVGLGVLVLAGAAMGLLNNRILAISVPSSVLPDLPGPFQAGLRREALATSGGTLVVDLWYPRATGTGPATNAAPGPQRTDRLARLGVIDGAPPAATAEPWPLLLFAPGWNGGRQSNTLQMAALASAGYVVAAMEDVGAAGSSLPVDMLDWDFSSEAGFRRSWQVGNQRLALMTDRMRHVLDALLVRNAGAGAWPLAGRIDPSRVGAFGFSFGGSVAAAVPRADSRVRAAANLDGWLFGDRSNAAPGVPYLSFNSHYPQIDRDAVSQRPGQRLMAEETLVDRRVQKQLLREPQTYALVLGGTQHQDFSDGLFAPPLRAYVRAPWGLWPAGQLRVHGIITALLLDFFDAHVRQSGTAALVRQRPGPYAEVTWLTAE